MGTVGGASLGRSVAARAVAAVGIGRQPKPASHDGSVGRVEGEPLCLAFRPVGVDGFPSFYCSALPSSTARVLKAQVRARCRALASVPDERIRLLYRGVELPDDGPVAATLPVLGPSDVIDLQFLVVGDQACHEEAARDGMPCTATAGGGVGLHACDGVPCPGQLAEVLGACSEALRQGVEPILASGGTGGTYFLRGRHDGQTLAVFKPKDEEAGAPLNPRGFEGRENTRQWRLGVPSGHRAAREVAAYMLDHDGFAGVPMTTLARGRNPGFAPLRGERGTEVVWKVGSLQVFVDTAETSDNFSEKLYSVANVHQVGILDVRISNFDRNHGNLLVETARDATGARSCRLVPVDHGCSLPDRLGMYSDDLAWMAWPQARQPFEAAALAYIANLDCQADARLLAQRLGLERAGLRLLEVTTRWLQIGAARGLTLHEIGGAIYRNAESPLLPSALECIIGDCLASSLAGTAARPSKVAFPTVALTEPIIRTMTCPPQQDVVGKPFEALGDGIFVVRDSRGQEIEWSLQLEEAFRRHLGEALERFAAARKGALFAKLPVPHEGTSGADTSEGDDLDEASTEGGEDGELLLQRSCKVYAPSAAARADGDALAQRSSTAYVPPHLRRGNAVPPASG